MLSARPSASRRIRGFTLPASSCRWTQRDERQQGAQSRSSSNFNPRLVAVGDLLSSDAGGRRNLPFVVRAGKAWLLGDEYTVADMATFPCVNNFVGFYGAPEIVGYDDLPEVDCML